MDENLKGESLKMMAHIMLTASGADVVAPAPLRAQAIEALELEDNEDFKTAEKVVKKADNPAEVIQGLILTTLRPSEMLKLYDTIRVGVQASLEFMKDHPEFREENPLARFGADFDID